MTFQRTDEAKKIQGIYENQQPLGRSRKESGLNERVEGRNERKDHTERHKQIIMPTRGIIVIYQVLADDDDRQHEAVACPANVMPAQVIDAKTQVLNQGATGGGCRELPAEGGCSSMEQSPCWRTRLRHRGVDCCNNQCAIATVTKGKWPSPSDTFLASPGSISWRIAKS